MRRFPSKRTQFLQARRLRPHKIRRDSVDGPMGYVHVVLFW
ncbi:hypothetical protein CAEBREN_31726 [Caenorhabditis brenneri]|uniref:Uncharacterized protein n=1 Tax=Caenorhabditis brenneri TaxID=135651 RepID=G0MVA6_CAEBE|nr:hypothetical protein CAEBREN_31726 [Caenorhabditis brenneri]